MRGAPYNLIVIMVQLTNPGEQPSALLRPRTRCSHPPAVIAAGRDPHTPAHESDGKHVAASLDHSILHRDVLAKHVAASRKKSRSFVTRLNSRRSWVSSSSRGRPLPTNARVGSCRKARRPRPQTVAPIPSSARLDRPHAGRLEHRHRFPRRLR